MYFLGFMKDISGIEEKLHTWTVFKSRFELKCNIHRKLRTRELTEIHRKKFWLLACVILHDIIFFVSSSEAQIFPFSLISLSVVVIDSINTDFPTISVILEPKYDHFYFWDKNHCNTQPNDLFTIIFTLFFTDNLLGRCNNDSNQLLAQSFLFQRVMPVLFTFEHIQLPDIQTGNLDVCSVHIAAFFLS